MSDEDEAPVMVEHPTPTKEEASASVDAPTLKDETNKEESYSSKSSTPELVKRSSDDQKEETEKTEDDDGEHSDDGPRPYQIVSVGTEEDAYAFTFHEEKLNEILAKIPPGWKVSVVSVVGAFRTGKSFLLSWFLRYLARDQQSIEGSSDGDKEDADKWYNQFQSLGNDGFDWRGGSDRNTTGIWMWSEPHFISAKSSGKKENIAVILVDTQGMFDHETTMALTASIFGLSTLLSSYQIYNVDKRIQEDNLQQLALFSEYARMAMTTHDDDDAGKKTSSSSEDVEKPFQLVEFLVRDWQHFDEEDDFDLMEKEVDDYLEKVIADRDVKDLQETREQILGCFEKVSCYAMTHPGFAVTKKKYNGDVKKVDETFLALLDRYCHRVFHADNIRAKKIHGRELTAVELGAYIKAYAGLFSTGAHFPEASTLLEATAGANNTNAVHMSVREYKDRMDRIAGPKCSNYVKPDELKELHQEQVEASMDVFESIATFGSKRDIDDSKQKLLKEISESLEIYKSLNDSRNPLAGLEMYIVPMSIAIVSYILRFISDVTCSSWSHTCKVTSEALSHFYAVAFFFMVIVAFTKAKQIKDVLKRVSKAIELMNEPSKVKAE
mmetsp:Transcript_4743/g.7209  ORF Transcript_4743/g.7209 Transcript_4743/m.7209 type:complete len:609 (+) Transcript_4743:156-1982(+)